MTAARHAQPRLVACVAACVAAAATCHAPSMAIEQIDARTIRLSEQEAADCARGCVLIPQAELTAYLATVRAQAYAAGLVQGEAKARAEMPATPPATVPRCGRDA